MSVSSLPRAIQDRLAAARARLRAVDLGLGLARAALAAATVVVVLFALDTTLEPPLLVLRAFALFMALVGAAVATVFLARPLRRPLSDDDVALLVEAEFPELEDGLVSAVQLARELERPDATTSAALIRSTIARTATRAAPLDFRRVVRTGPLIPLWVLIGALFGFGALVVQNPVTRDYAVAFYRRVVLGDEAASYPKLVSLRLAVEDDIAVAKGDDLTVEALVEKGASLVRGLVIRTRLGRDVEQRDMTEAAAGRWRKVYENITESFSFQVESEEHGVRTPWRTVRVVQRPRVEGYDFVLRYPEYVGRAAEVVGQPDMRVPVGTEVTYLVVANRPIDQAALVFEHVGRPTLGPDGRPVPGQVEHVEGPAPRSLAALSAEERGAGDVGALGAAIRRRGLEGDEARRALVGSFRVTKAVRFHFQLVSREPDGRSYDQGKKPVVFSIEAVLDQRPVVSIPIPGRTKQVTPQAKVPLTVDARDDYGLASVELRLTAEVPGGQAPEPRRVPLAGLEPNAKQARIAHVLDVSDLRLEPGAVVRYVAVARDQNVDEALRERESRPFELRIVRPEDLERILQDRLSALRERLESIANDEQEARTATEAFAGELGPKDLLTDDDRRRLQRLDQDQRRVTKRLEEVRDELADIRQERALNRLTDEAAVALTQELLDATKDLAERASPAVSRELDDARQAQALDARLKARLARVPDLQQDIVAQLRALAARIGKWGDFTEVIQEVRDLLRSEDRIIEATREAAQQKNR